jgi:WD40-like Beta Propeller Repeat
MLFFQADEKRSVASVGFIATLVAAVWCASCGSKTNGGLPGDDGTTPGGSDGGGDCFNCSSSGASGGGGSSGFSGGGTTGDGGIPTVPPQNTLVTHTSCPGSLSAATVTSLKAASANSASLKWLYPYDATLFPGGLASPVLQWSQTGTPDGVYVHMHSGKYEYTGCFKGTSPPQLKIPEIEWATAYAQSAGKGDPLTVELSTITGSTVSGAIKESWTFAKGSLAGVVYYNTYGSMIVPGQAAGGNGAVMRIANGKPQAFLYTNGGVSPFGPCVSCHALSSNGSVLVAQQHFYPGSDPLNGKGSMSFDLTTTAKPDPTAPMASTLNDDWGFSAVYPDGTILLTSGEAGDSTTTPIFPGVSGNNPGMLGPKPATMYDTKTGKTISYTGLSTPYAMMPMFSPDGLHIVYTEAPAPDAGVGGHTMTVMDFDLASKTFSNARQVFHDDTNFPGWPFFTPDGKSIIFALGNTNNFASEEPPFPAPTFSSQLYIVSAAGGTPAHRLDSTSGLDPTGKDYLPSPKDDDNLDFYPTVNPISAGGYFWAYFTSRRSYGNLYAKGSGDVGSKSIWVSAIDINAPAGTDPSHPAFYLPGQELGSGNIRAFAVLAPCKGDGSGCESGLDCCGGTCTTGKCGVPQACAGTNDRCTPTVPCCLATDMCIGGYCGVAPPK